MRPNATLSEVRGNTMAVAIKDVWVPTMYVIATLVEGLRYGTTFSGAGDNTTAWGSMPYV